MALSHVGQNEREWIGDVYGRTAELCEQSHRNVDSLLLRHCLLNLDYWKRSTKKPDSAYSLHAPNTEEQDWDYAVIEFGDQDWEDAVVEIGLVYAFSKETDPRIYRPRSLIDREFSFICMERVVETGPDSVTAAAYIELLYHFSEFPLTNMLPLFRSVDQRIKSSPSQYSQLFLAECYRFMGWEWEAAVIYRSWIQQCSDIIKVRQQKIRTQGDDVALATVRMLYTVLAIARHDEDAIDVFRFLRTIGKARCPTCGQDIAPGRSVSLLRLSMTRRCHNCIGMWPVVPNETLGSLDDILTVPGDTNEEQAKMQEILAQKAQDSKEEYMHYQGEVIGLNQFLCLLGDKWDIAKSEENS